MTQRIAPLTGLCIAAGIVMASSLSGCAPEGDEQTEVTAGPSAESGQDATETTTEVAPETVTADPRACLHGAWLADNEYFLESMREFGDEIIGVTGEVTLTFADDGTIATEYRDWRITALTEGFESVIIREGIDRGTFTADESRLSIHETEIGSVLTVKAAGVDMPIAPAPVDYSQASYTCDAAEAVITTPDGNAILTRIGG